MSTTCILPNFEFSYSRAVLLSYYLYHSILFPSELHFDLVVPFVTFSKLFFNLWQHPFKSFISKIRHIVSSLSLKICNLLYANYRSTQWLHVIVTIQFIISLHFSSSIQFALFFVSWDLSSQHGLLHIVSMDTSIVFLSILSPISNILG